MENLSSGKNLSDGDGTNPDVPDFFKEKWVPPPSLTLKKLHGLEGVRVSLNYALCLMTFGDPRHALPTDRMLENECFGLRPAYKALFGAGKLGKVKFFGSRSRFGTPNEELSVAEFVPKRMWCHTEESLGGDIFTDSMDEYRAARDKSLNQIWWNVYVETASFAGWLKGELTADPAETPAQKALLAEAPKPLPPMQVKILQIYYKLWPNDQCPVRVKDRDNAIIEAWPEGDTKPCTKTIRRAFKARTNQDISGQSLVVR